jgi:hypothetical protein
MAVELIAAGISELLPGLTGGGTSRAGVRRQAERSAAARRRLLRRHVLLPSDHGSWVLLLAPLVAALRALPRAAR